VSGNTFTGESGIGVQVDAGVASVSDNTFSGLNSAFNIVADTATTISSNTVDACGIAVSTTVPNGQAAITVTATTSLSITNNTITNGPDDIIEVTDNSENINMMFNSLTDNAKGIDNNDADTAQTLNATHNWWGVATGPATGFNVTAGAVNDTSGYLGADATGSFALSAATLLTQTTVGVDVVPTYTTAPAIMGVANYATNPQAATPATALAGGFYDVYLTEATAGDVTSVLLKFYNANLSEDTVVYVWGTLGGGWQPCTTQGVNMFGNYAYVTVTGSTVPAITDLAGTPFALCEVSTPPTIAVSSLVPAMGGDDVSVDPTFTWGAVTGATYEFALAEDLGLADPFSVIDYSATADINAHPCRETLKYSTTYYWRVRAITATETGAWAVGLFTTEAEPEEAAAVELPDITVEQPDVTVQPAEVDITVEPAQPVIPDYLLWVIIGVGAVLVIALIVLIIRTRRVA
jgi:hypothetical protein